MNEACEWIMQHPAGGPERRASYVRKGRQDDLPEVNYVSKSIAKTQSFQRVAKLLVLVLSFSLWHKPCDLFASANFKRVKWINVSSSTVHMRLRFLWKA